MRLQRDGAGELPAEERHPGGQARKVGLNLRHVDALPFDVAERAREDLLAATIVVRNVKALFLAYEAAGLELHQRYREQPWGAHDFVVADPDGNLVHFASPPCEG